MLNRRSERRVDIAIKDIYESSESNYFTLMSQIIHNQIEDMCLKLRHFAQELGILKDLARKNEKFVEEYGEILRTVDSVVESVSSRDSNVGKILYTHSLIAKELDIQMENGVAYLAKAHSEASKIYFFLHDYEESERKRLEDVVKEKAIHSKINPAVFRWKEDTDNFQQFLYSVIHAKQLKARKEPIVEYSDIMESQPFQPQEDKEFECSRNNMKGSNSCNNSPEHIYEVFSYAAQTLANINNLQKIILFLKLNLEKLDGIFKAIHKQTRIKLECYYIKGILAEESKKKIWKTSVYAHVLDDLIGIQNSIESEAGKLSTHIMQLHGQIIKNQKSCLPIQENALTGKQSVFEKIKLLMANITKLVCILKFLNKSEDKVSTQASRKSLSSPVEKFDDENDQFSYKTLCNLGPKDTIKQIELSRRLSSNVIYKMMHIRSTILKKIQPHSLAMDLYISRKDLSTQMFKFIESETSDPNLWSKNVRVLTVKKFDLNLIENKVHHSYTINQMGHHSFNSSWELQTDNEMQEEIDGSNDAIQIARNSWSSASEESSSISESSLSCVIESDNEFVEREPIEESIDKRRSLNGKLTESMQKYLQLSKINVKSLPYLTNKLNEQVKTLHKAGVNGWKREYKKLKHKEEKIDLVNEAIKSRTNNDFFNNRSRSVATARTTRSIHPNLPCVYEEPSQHSNNSKEPSDLPASRRTRRENTLFAFFGPKESIASRYSILQRMLTRDPVSVDFSQTAKLKKEESKESKPMVNTASAFSTIYPNTFDPHRLAEDIMNSLDKLSTHENPKFYKAISSLQNKHSTMLQRKIRYLRQDRKMSPLMKLTSVRNEFDRVCMTDRLTKSRGSTSSKKDVHLISLS